MPDGIERVPEQVLEFEVLKRGSTAARSYGAFSISILSVERF